MNAFAAALREALTQSTTDPVAFDGARGCDGPTLLRDAQQLAARRHALGLAGGIASRLDNGLPALRLDLAARLSDAVHVPVPPFFSAAQLAHVLDDSGAGEWVSAADAAPPGPDWQEIEALATPHWRWWHRASAAPRWPEGTACITYTSGTTGAPKGVCLSAELLLRVARSLGEASADAAPRRHLSVLPLSTLLENVAVYAALLRGVEVRLPGLARVGYSGAAGIDPRTLFACIDAHAPDSVIFVPQLLEALLGVLETGVALRHPLRFVAVGGARVAAALHARAERLGLPLYEGYGLSECGSVVCLNRPGARRRGTVGRPLPHVALRVDATGEVHVRGAAQIGYLGGPLAGAEIATGDLGRIDADGYLSIDGRRRNVFITAYGRNVAPEWIEAELCGSGVIAQAVVDGEARAHNVAVLVACRPDSSDADLQRAIDAVNAALPDYARVTAFVRAPRPFDVASGLATANGRVRRAEVLARFAREIDAVHAALAESPHMMETA